MKRLITTITLATLLFAACTGREATKTAGGAVFELSPEILAAKADTLVDIGNIRSGEVVRYDARLRNTGTEPLVIKDVVASCGCTSVEYEKQPIPPGEEGYFSFRLDTRGMWGMQMKTIEIHTSASPGAYRMMVQAEVSEN